jgi:hypothetical protein
VMGLHRRAIGTGASVATHVKLKISFAVACACAHKTVGLTWPQTLRAPQSAMLS